MMLRRHYCVARKSLTINVHRIEYNAKILNCANDTQQINKTTIKIFKYEKTMPSNGNVKAHNLTIVGKFCGSRKYINFHSKRFSSARSFALKKNAVVSIVCELVDLLITIWYTKKRMLWSEITAKTLLNC